MSRRRVAMFLPSLRGGGAERVMLSLAATIAEVHHVDLVVAVAGGELRDEVPAGVEVVDLGANRVATSLPKLVRHLRRSRPDAVLSALNHANLVAIAARSMSRIPARLVLTEHSHLSTATQHAINRRDRVVPALMRLLYPRADAIIAVSQGVADDLAGRLRLSASTLHVVPNPVDVERLAHLAEPDPGHPWLTDARRGPVVVGVGRLSAAKGFDTLIEALAIARSDIDVRLILLGEGEEREHLQATAVRHGVAEEVDLHGFVGNPHPFLRAADLFVLSSRWEGLPTALIEAVALTGRIVATDSPGGTREILEDAAVGTLVPVGDPGLLAAAMVAALERPAAAHPEALGRYAPASVRRTVLGLLGLPLNPS